MNNEATDRKEKIKRRYHKSLLVQLSIAAIFICILWFMSSSKNEPVQIERKTIPSETRSLKKEPDLEYLLSLREPLELSPKQVKQLTNLLAEKDKRLIPINKQLEIAIDDFDAFMRSRGKKRTNMGEIFSHSTPATNLGKHKRILIESYSQQGMDLLANQQRELAHQLLSRQSSESKTRKGIGEVNVAH